ncbi:MAG: hypothetical protein J7K81_10515 [Methanophagales archaeon]|nr:hypothetical protein [Methanophagales archaeon]
MGEGGEEVRRYTEKASEDLLFKVLEKEFNEAMQDVLEDRRKITDPDVCSLFNLWYLRSHVDGLQREMREGFEKIDARFEKIDARFEKIDARFERMEHRISQIFIFLGVGFTILAALITVFQFLPA